MVLQSTCFNNKSIIFLNCQYIPEMMQAPGSRSLHHHPPYHRETFMMVHQSTCFNSPSIIFLSCQYIPEMMQVTRVSLTWNAAAVPLSRWLSSSIKTINKSFSKNHNSIFPIHRSTFSSTFNSNSVNLPHTVPKSTFLSNPSIKLYQRSFNQGSEINPSIIYPKLIKYSNSCQWVPPESCSLASSPALAQENFPHSSSINFIQQSINLLPTIYQPSSSIVNIFRKLCKSPGSRYLAMSAVLVYEFLPQ